MAANLHRTFSNAFSGMIIVCISNQISQKFVPKDPIDSKSALVQVMAWHWTGNKSISVNGDPEISDAYMRQQACIS